jgi:hypothetical protein
MKSGSVSLLSSCIKYLTKQNVIKIFLQAHTCKTKFMRHHITGEKLDMVVRACHSSYCGKHKWEDHGPVWTREKVRPHLKTAREKRGWSGSMPA